jgi:flagellar protein FlaJ
MIKIKPLLAEMNSALDEMLEAKSNIHKVNSELNQIDKRYQRGELDYKEYTHQCSAILGGKTRTQISENYSFYLTSLKNRVREINSKAFKLIYDDRSYELLLLDKDRRPEKAHLSLPSLESLDISDIEIPLEHIEIKVAGRLAKKPAPEIIPEIEAPRPEELGKLETPSPLKMSFFARLMYAFTAKNKPWLSEQEQANVSFGGFLTKEFLNYLFKGEVKESSFGRTKILPSILSFEGAPGHDRDISGSKADLLDPYLLEKEIKEIKELISRKRPEVYRASTLGYLANITVRKITIYFIEQFPDFFKGVYRDIRYANIRVLANTYINIVFFLTIISGLITLPLATVIYSLQGDNPLIIIVKTLFTTLVVSAVTFFSGMYYPATKAKSRKRSINTNLPFAIDHMSSVIASGVSPATMFKLISNSREYGEISVEIDKVSNYVEFFGYDVLTSLRAVALTTPSEVFKEFIDGFVSTIETGGDLKEYLSQESAEAILNYRLERQKYVEALSTYSDIYTGVLIAAPLFFVIALSLVSVIGGNIGGMSVSTIISLGTYVVIPIMNILFLIFLEASQPEI